MATLPSTGLPRNPLRLAPRPDSSLSPCLLVSYLFAELRCNTSSLRLPCPVEVTLFARYRWNSIPLLRVGRLNFTNKYYLFLIRSCRTPPPRCGVSIRAFNVFLDKHVYFLWVPRSELKSACGLPFLGIATFCIDP